MSRSARMALAGAAGAFAVSRVRVRRRAALNAGRHAQYPDYSGFTALARLTPLTARVCGYRVFTNGLPIHHDFQLAGLHSDA
jgi:hypothetical protein